MPHRRIHKAAVAAMLCHALVLAVSVYLISWLSIPSTIDRVLNLSLNSTPLDGNVSHHSSVDETLNNVEQGISKSELVDELQPEESPRELPAKTIDDRTPPLAEQIHKSTEQKSRPQSTPETFASEQITAELPPNTLSDENLKEIQEDTLLTRQPSSIPPLLKLEQELQSVPASAVEQQMLNSKLDEIASTLTDLDEIPSQLEWESDGQRYSASLYRVPMDNEMGLPEVRVRVKTEIDGTELSTEMSMKQLAFSNFAQFVHRWDSDLHIHDDQLDGRFHSNSRINLEFGRHSGPVFLGKVTTASYRVNMNRHSRRSLKKNVFLGGLETGVKKIAMPQPSMLYFDDALSVDEHSVRFETDTRIIFYADGHFSAEPLAEGGLVSHYPIGEQPLYIHADANTTLYLKGTVNGQVLVYSPKRITIENNLVYADRSRSAQSDDFLGLVSGRNIVIAGPSVTGRGDLEIDASIYAKGRFIVKSYKTRRSGTLVVFGSVSAGSMSATEPRYATKITFDPRLEHRRPPKFPTTDRYEVENKKIIWSRLNTPVSSRLNKE